MPETRPVTSGARRGCGLRQPGGAYLAVPLGPGGRPVEDFLIDPPTLLDADALGVTSVGVTLLERDGITHVVDIVGREHYPTVAAYVEEARRLGISRRISRTADFTRLSDHSRLLLAHAHADIANAPEFATDARCPCEVPSHLAAGYHEMCARLWWQEPLPGAQHRLAVFMSVQVAQIEVVRDPTGGHHETITAAAAGGLAVIEVDA